MEGLIIILLCSFVLPHVIISTTVDSIDTTHPIRDGETLVSASEIFELGFFSPGGTGKRYLGIWYKKSVKTVVWVANREVPLNDSSGVAKVTNQGILVLLSGEGKTIWSSHSSRPVRNPVAQLLDSGNLVVKDEWDESFIWQSFDYPGDTLLPGMKIGKDFVTGLHRYLSSWVHYRLVQEDTCDNYGLCGANGFCNNNNSPVCTCLSGFVPKNSEERDKDPGSGGCVRKTRLNCSGDGFQEISGVKFPDSGQPPSNNSMNLEECNIQCTKNCSCTAYANLDIRDGGSGCLLWFGDLIDIKHSTGRGQSIYVRMAGTELDQTHSSSTNKSSSKKKMWIAVISAFVVVVVTVGIALVLFLGRKKRQKKKGSMQGLSGSSNKYKDQKDDLELPLFDFATIARATNNFSPMNKIGEGGFGSVYKGILEDGQEIAVKRLSKSSTQGDNEFKNEVDQIAKVQHRNLVKLLGCCIETDEKALIYEFMPNKSLDFFIFDQAQSMSMDWPMRHNIINGIARGLLYLHQDSRQRIIHRDLKAANILLDNEMNAKISDFGLARSFGEKQTAANTSRVVGTYGYMSPEYAIDGVYSIKSDVFSFGVLVLEIVSGKRNRGFCHPDHQLNLLGHAWRLFNEGKSLELIAAPIRDTRNSHEIIRSIHVGLLCVQQSPDDRPSMSNVVLMLSSKDPLPQPKQPGFFHERDLVEFSSSSSSQKQFLTSNFTITVLDAR
ncbi:S-locus lectin protein kinase family protein, putative isoform 1 [Theobroma cacao]|uniref:Receptor-like serine/threonine-protein kinase n=1 Tax=Theobroma cacao TaxID=3641 RepID=A0A061F6Q9_THECC|nr:S-locus lectin protein kinase family protein, putative isoform 1 [Theobroma cacao]EOY12711.1 S-locus lectin protein kinase family protein, putative isoform 1 [Theobroma cacao]